MIRWNVRDEPLEAVGVLGIGGVAHELARALLAGDPGLVRGVVGAERILLACVGPLENLPWTNGAIYLGKDPRAPSLLMPTTMIPEGPLPLLERAVARRANGRTPVVIAPPTVGVSLGLARPFARTRLEAWVEEGSS